MAKILLVEDDNNLREIYEARLQAEGYEIVSAMDGEAALVIAKKERPDLVISDVMMPRISGFEMLDILRNTDGLKDVKVIMLTALGQAEDKTRADSLGADRYLVKSQVTLEDIVKAAQELLGEAPAATPAAPATATASAPELTATRATPSAPATPPVAQPTTNAGEPTTPAAPAAPNAQPPSATPVPQSTPAASESPAPAAPTPTPSADTTAPTTPATSHTPEPASAAPAASTADDSTAASSTPTPTPTPTTPPMPVAPAMPTTQSVSDEEKTIKSQIENFVKQNSQTAPSAPEPPTTPATPPTQQSSPAMMADAINKLVADSSDQPQPKKPVGEKVIEPITPPPTNNTASVPDVTPTPAAPPVPSSTPATDEPSDIDDEGTTRKKIIQPITEAGAPQSDLNALLAKEGITNFDDTHTDTPGQPSTPGLPTTPHPPGHVISPNGGQNGVDPNSIAL